MSDTYIMDEAPPVDPAAGPPEDVAAEGSKQSQQEANYREGNPQRSCGLCERDRNRAKLLVSELLAATADMMNPKNPMFAERNLWNVPLSVPVTQA